MSVVLEELKKDMLAWEQRQQEKVKAVEGIRAIAAKLPVKQRRLIEAYLDQIQPPAA